jgi:hypothetical protein
MKVVIVKYCPECQQRYPENYYVCVICGCLLLAQFIRKEKEKGDK